LSQSFQNAPIKFREFIKKQYAAVNKGNFPWTWEAMSSAHHSSIGDGVVWRPKRSLSH
jgi:hypothetical protein